MKPSWLTIRPASYGQTAIISQPGQGEVLVPLRQIGDSSGEAWLTMRCAPTCIPQQLDAPNVDCRGWCRCAMPNPLPRLQTPRVSVIVPMHDHRGLALDAIASWVNAQTCDPNLFEVIVIGDDTVKALEASLRSLLRQQDQLISVTTRNEMEHYDIGAKQSGGEYLFFTEAHCLAEPDAVTDILCYFTTQPIDGFSVHSSSISHNRLAHMETMMYESGMQEWTKDEHWRKVNMRGFAIRRKAYEQVGGFSYQYGRFAEWLLAATLHLQGYRLGFAATKSVRHINPQRFATFDAYIRKFIEGEGRYRREHAGTTITQLFGAPPEWEELRGDKQHVSRLIRRVLWQQLRTRQSLAATLRGWQMVLRAYFRLFARELVGKRGALLRRALLVWYAKLRCYLWWFSPDRMYRAFQDYWQRTTAFYRVEFLLEQADHLAINAPPPQTMYNMQHIAAEYLFGFHGLETYEGRHFRWSSPAAALCVTLPPGNYQATVQLLNVRPLHPERELTIFFNATPIRNITYDVQAAALHFPVTQTMFATAPPHWLILLCMPLRIDGQHSPEKRQLGLPIVTIALKENPPR